MNIMRIASYVGTILPLFVSNMSLQAIAWLLAGTVGVQWVCFKLMGYIMKSRDVTRNRKLKM